ncbi:MAG: hypothetical protein RBU36_09565 [Thermoanaerobaculia bacterium]|jgi:hypothetical protein|nr:hypothetical protein [Thermoanaerobaculia bacterium]
MNHASPLPRWTAALAAAVLSASALAGPSAPPKAASKTPVFKDVKAQTLEFMRYADMSLAPEQEKVKDDVLSAIPTVCCKKFSMKTCCCPCNMAMTIWGLSNYMLVVKGANAAELKSAVLDWVKFIGPAGYTGDACFTGGCNRPFSKNGCGGMDHKNVVF